MKHKESYLASSGAGCPYCGTSANVEGGPVDIEAGVARQEVTCQQCGGCWEDMYLLADAIPVEAQQA